MVPQSESKLFGVIDTVFVPIAEPIIGEEELNLVVKTLKSGWISSIGKNIPEFERKSGKGEKVGLGEPKTG